MFVWVEFCCFAGGIWVVVFACGGFAWWFLVLVLVFDFMFGVCLAWFCFVDAVGFFWGLWACWWVCVG